MAGEPRVLLLLDLTLVIEADVDEPLEPGVGHHAVRHVTHRVAGVAVKNVEHGIDRRLRNG